jgi:hypothetical protein
MAGALAARVIDRYQQHEIPASAHYAYTSFRPYIKKGSG